MDQPQPAEELPDGPLTEQDARAYLDEPDVVAVWVMDPDSSVRSVALPADAPEEPVVDLVVETETAYEMYSFSGGRWMDYGTQRKDDDESPSMAGTLESYRVLAGTPEEF